METRERTNRSRTNNNGEVRIVSQIRLTQNPCFFFSSMFASALPLDQNWKAHGDRDLTLSRLSVIFYFGEIEMRQTRFESSQTST